MPRARSGTRGEGLGEGPRRSPKDIAARLSIIEAATRLAMGPTPSQCRICRLPPEILKWVHTQRAKIPATSLPAILAGLHAGEMHVTINSLGEHFRRGHEKEE